MARTPVSDESVDRVLQLMNRRGAVEEIMQSAMAAVLIELNRYEHGWGGRSLMLAFRALHRHDRCVAALEKMGIAPPENLLIPLSTRVALMKRVDGLMNRLLGVQRVSRSQGGNKDPLKYLRKALEFEGSQAPHHAEPQAKNADILRMVESQFQRVIRRPEVALQLKNETAIFNFVAGVFKCDPQTVRRAWKKAIGPESPEHERFNDLDRQAKAAMKAAANTARKVPMPQTTVRRSERTAPSKESINRLFKK